jgi:hypothetical protein
MSFDLWVEVESSGGLSVEDCAQPRQAILERGKGFKPKTFRNVM